MAGDHATSTSPSAVLAGVVLLKSVDWQGRAVVDGTMVNLRGRGLLLVGFAPEMTAELASTHPECSLSFFVGSIKQTLSTSLSTAGSTCCTKKQSTTNEPHLTGSRRVFDIGLRWFPKRFVAAGGERSISADTGLGNRPSKQKYGNNNHEVWSGFKEIYERRCVQEVVGAPRQGVIRASECRLTALSDKLTSKNANHVSENWRGNNFCRFEVHGVWEISLRPNEPRHLQGSA